MQRLAQAEDWWQGCGGSHDGGGKRPGTGPDREVEAVITMPAGALCRGPGIEPDKEAGALGQVPAARAEERARQGNGGAEEVVVVETEDWGRGQTKK